MEKQEREPSSRQPVKKPPIPENSLLEFFLEAPFPEFDLDIERSEDPPRSVE